MVDFEASIRRLLDLPAERTSLEQWYAGEDPESRAESDPSPDSPFQSLYRVFMAHARVDPGLTLEGARHLAAIVGPSSSPQDRAQVSRLLGHMLTASGRAREALPRYEMASRLFRRSRDRGEEGLNTTGWIFALALCGETKRAHEVARRGRTLLRGSDPTTRAKLETNLGHAWQLSGRIDLAADRYREALASFTRAGANWDAAITAYNLTHLHLLLGKTKEARRCAMQARGPFVRAGSRLLVLYVDAALASVDLGEGHWDRGMAAIAKLRAEFRTLGDDRALAWMHRQLAVLFASLGAVEAALAESEGALRISDRLGLEVDATHAALLHGQLLASGSSPQEAWVHLDRARSHWIRMGHVWMRHRIDLELARLLVRENQPRRALETIRGSLSYLDRRDPGGDGALGRSIAAAAHFQLGRPKRARAMALKSWRAAKRYPSKLERPATALLLARCAHSLGDRRGAFEWIRRAVAELEDLLRRFGTRHLRVLVGDSRDRIYGGAVDLALELGGRRAGEVAIDLVSRSRSPTLIEDMLGHGRRLGDETRTAMIRLRDSLFSGEGTEPSETRTRALRIHMEELDSRLSHEHRRTPAVIRRALRDRGLGQWRDRLGDKQMIIFDKGSSGWRAFILAGSGGSRLVELPGLERALREDWMPLRLVFETAARMLKTRRREFLSRTLSRSLEAFDHLRAAVWDPLEIEAKQAVVIPHRDLHSIPLEALGESAGCLVSRLPHPSLLRADRPRQNRRALLLHGPGRGARREVAKISTLLEGAGFDVSIGDRRGDLDSTNAPVGVLHVAAHGVFHRQSWLMSGLRLVDGWLGFEQLHRERIRGALVHVSSCESGVAELLPGSDIDGWITAGLAAGARDMVLTLWRVEEDSVGQFSESFYRSWVRGDRSPRAARTARAELRLKRDHPYYWAPFVVVS